MLGAVGWAGHAFPVIALARELQRRGNEVVVHTAPRWRPAIDDLGLDFVAAEERMDFGGLPDGGAPAPTLAQAAGSLASTIEELDLDVVVSDLFTLAPALGAELAAVPHATLIPHPYPVHEPGLPVFFLGMQPPRTALGAGAWRAAGPLRTLLQPRLRRVRAELNRTRAELGLAPIESLHGPISEGLTLVATFPQLEYPRRWPAHVHVTGPMLFELPHPEVDLPVGSGPLVLVAASTEQDPELSLVSIALKALESEPVRVLATINRRGERWRGPVPRNAAVVDWVSYAQAMPAASLVICSGGHGTVARALADAVPVLVCPDLGDMAENGARVAWAGVGSTLPSRLLRPTAMRWAVRRLLGDPGFSGRARDLAEWSRANPGPEAGARLVERYAGR